MNGRGRNMKKSRILSVEKTVDWREVPELEIAERVRPRETQAEAFAQIAYTPDELLVCLTAQEPEIRREEKGLLGAPCNDSCLEFFFCPMEGDLRYFNFEWNPNGCLYLGFATGPKDLIRLVIAEEKQKELFCPQIHVAEGEWSVRFRIPYTFIRQFFPDFCAETGKAIRGNFYKCGDKLAQPHSLAWNMITRQGEMRFHTPEEFGCLEFA